MTPAEATKIRKAFEALRADVEQFDGHAPINPERHDSGLFSERVPPFMRSYLVNWLRQFMTDHGDAMQSLLSDACGGKPPMCLHEWGPVYETGIGRATNCSKCGEIHRVS